MLLIILIFKLKSRMRENNVVFHRFCFFIYFKQLALHIKLYKKEAGVSLEKLLKISDNDKGKFMVNYSRGRRILAK